MPYPLPAHPRLAPRPITRPTNVASRHVLEKCGRRFRGKPHCYGHGQRFYTIDNPAAAPQA